MSPPERHVELEAPAEADDSAPDSPGGDGAREEAREEALAQAWQSEKKYLAFIWCATSLVLTAVFFGVLAPAAE